MMLSAIKYGGKRTVAHDLNYKMWQVKYNKIQNTASRALVTC